MDRKIRTEKSGQKRNNINQIKILETLTKDPNITQENISKKLKIGRTTVTDNIRKLKDEGKIKRIGSDRKGYWEVKK